MFHWIYAANAQHSEKICNFEGFCLHIFCLNIVSVNIFSCPEQLNRTHCPSLGWSVALLPLTIRVLTTLQSEPGDL